MRYLGGKTASEVAEALLKGEEQKVFVWRRFVAEYAVRGIPRVQLN